jgi:xanthine dehydrogenase accessory factor
MVNECKEGSNRYFPGSLSVMKSIYKQTTELIKANTPFVLATVIRTWGSAPRKAGSHMLMTNTSMTGSVSGGCVENDVFREAQQLIGTRNNKQLHYGIADAEAWQVGLSCGGEIDVLLESFNPGEKRDQDYWNAIRIAVEKDTGGIVVHNLYNGVAQREVLLPQEWSLSKFENKALECYDKRIHQFVEGDEAGYFLELIAPKHKLLLIGAAHITAELVQLAKGFDFEVTVIDPRGFFTSRTTFSNPPDQMHAAWPAEVLSSLELTPYTYAVTLSHDPKIDDQALELLLRSKVGYIGCLGSKKTHEKRKARLDEKGFSGDEIQRIHAPVGIDIHAQSAQEIALSILAELIREKNRYF